MSRIPLFVVVGNVNQGKSSIVATLSENGAIPIDSYPGTTRRSGTYVLRADGRDLIAYTDNSLEFETAFLLQANKAKLKVFSIEYM